MLGSLVLALHNDIGWYVGDAHGRIRGVDMLAAGARRAISIDAQILVVDFDFDVLVDFRIDEERGKGRVTPSCLIERRDTHQAMYARFGSEQAVCVLALDSESDVLQSCFFARLVIDDL